MIFWPAVCQVKIFPIQQPDLGLIYNLVLNMSGWGKGKIKRFRKKF